MRQIRKATGSVHQLQQALELVAGGHRAGLDVLGTKNPRNFTHHEQLPISKHDEAGLEVLGEQTWNVLWKESRHEVPHCPEVTGASVIKVLLLPEISRDELA